MRRRVAVCRSTQIRTSVAAARERDPTRTSPPVLQPQAACQETSLTIELCWGVRVCLLSLSEPLCRRRVLTDRPFLTCRSGSGSYPPLLMVLVPLSDSQSSSDESEPSPRLRTSCSASVHRAATSCSASRLEAQAISQKHPWKSGGGED